jgi:hypothetical protein
VRALHLFQTALGVLAIIRMNAPKADFPFEAIDSLGKWRLGCFLLVPEHGGEERRKPSQRIS